MKAPTDKAMREIPQKKEGKTHRNFTLRLSEPALGRFIAYAESQNESLSGVAARAIASMMERDEAKRLLH